MILTGACQDRSTRLRIQKSSYLAESDQTMPILQWLRQILSLTPAVFVLLSRSCFLLWMTELTWGAAMLSAELASSLSWDFSRARRAASFTSLNFSENFSIKRGTNKKQRVSGDERVTAQMNLCECICRSSNLMQLLLRCKAEAVHGVCPAVCPLSKLLGRLGKCHAGCDGAVDDCLNMQREQQRRRMRPHSPHEMTQIIRGGCFCNVFIIISVKIGFLLHASYLVFHFRD